MAGVVRTIVPDEIAFGEARMTSGKVTAFVRVPDGDDFLDIVLRPALLGELLAKADEARVGAARV